MKKIAILCLMALAALYVQAQSEVVIAGDNVCLRFRPDNGTKWTGTSAPHFNTGDKLPCAGQVGDFYKVKYRGDYYYVPKQYARPRGTHSSSSARATPYSNIVVAGDRVCLRFRPDESTKWTGSSAPHFNTGDYLRCVGETGDYYKVVYREQYYYIPKRYGRPRN